MRPSPRRRSSPAGYADTTARPRCRRAAASKTSSEISMRAGPRRQAERLDHPRMQLAGMAEQLVADRERRTAAGVERRVLVGRDLDLGAERAAEHSRRLDRVRPRRTLGPAPTSRVARDARRGPRRSGRAGRAARRRARPASAASGRTPAGSVGARRAAAAPEHRTGLEQRDVGQPAADVARQRSEQPGQQRRAKVRLGVGDRVRDPHRRHPADRPARACSRSAESASTNGEHSTSV